MYFSASTGGHARRRSPATLMRATSPIHRTQDLSVPARWRGWAGPPTPVMRE